MLTLEEAIKPIPFFLRGESPSAIELEMDKAHEVKVQ